MTAATKARVTLTRLDEEWAVFGSDGSRYRLSVNRADWERQGRPMQLLIEVSSVGG